MFVPRSVDRLRPNKDRQTCQASPRRLNTRASRSAPSSVAHPLGRVAPARLPRRCTELPLRRPVVGQNSICTLDVGRQGGEAGRQCTSYSLCWALCALRYSNRHPPSVSSALAECASLQNALVGEMLSILAAISRARLPTHARASLPAHQSPQRSEPSKAREGRPNFPRGPRTSLESRISAPIAPNIARGPSRKRRPRR